VLVLKSVCGKNLRSGHEEGECLLEKTQHFTVPGVLVEMGTLLKLARVTVLLVVHVQKNK
jgi:hypothetical protein